MVRAVSKNNQTVADEARKEGNASCTQTTPQYQQAEYLKCLAHPCSDQCISLLQLHLAALATLCHVVLVIPSSIEPGGPCILDYY